MLFSFLVVEKPSHDQCSKLPVITSDYHRVGNDIA